jgi:hypothetical protein
MLSTIKPYHPARNPILFFPRQQHFSFQGSASTTSSLSDGLWCTNKETGADYCPLIISSIMCIIFIIISIISCLTCFKTRNIVHFDCDSSSLIKDFKRILNRRRRNSTNDTVSLDSVYIMSPSAIRRSLPNPSSNRIVFDRLDTLREPIPQMNNNIEAWFTEESQKSSTNITIPPPSYQESVAAGFFHRDTLLPTTTDVLLPKDTSINHNINFKARKAIRLSAAASQALRSQLPTNGSTSSSSPSSLSVDNIVNEPINIQDDLQPQIPRPIFPLYRCLSLNPAQSQTDTINSNTSQPLSNNNLYRIRRLLVDENTFCQHTLPSAFHRVISPMSTSSPISQQHQFSDDIPPSYEIAVNSKNLFECQTSQNQSCANSVVFNSNSIVRPYLQEAYI